MNFFLFHIYFRRQSRYTQMGIRGLQTFIEQKLGLLENFQLNNCNVLFDGNSIYHQMYSECHLTCLFGGEYEKFAIYCRQLFQSFQKCRINVIVVFDGARIDNRKLATTLERSRKRIDFSTKLSVNLNLSPLLLRQTFINVLNEMDIPHISAIGEGDDECVSLANHLDCYLISRDSDYYVYNLKKGYIPFDYVDVNPIENELGCLYLSAQLYQIENLLMKFPGLTHPTLSLACCLCGNDYLKSSLVEPVFSHIIATVEKKFCGQKISKVNQTKHWYAMQWMRHFDTLDIALENVFQSIKKSSESDKIEKQLRSAVETYLNPTDTLIYRFRLSINSNLEKSPVFNQLARDYLGTLDLTDEQIHDLVEFKERSLSKDLIDKLTNLQLSESFIELLIHRRLICSAHVEVEEQPSIYVDAIPILLPCLPILFKLNHEENNDRSIVIYHRVLRQLKPCVYSFEDHDNEFDPTHREEFVYRCLQISSALREQMKTVHSDYHFWLMIIQYWYSIRQLSSVYLYAIIISLIRSIFLTDNNQTEQSTDEINPLNLSLTDRHLSTYVDLGIRQTCQSKLKKLTKKVYDMKKFDCSIIHELNCLQTIYMFSLKMNEFIGEPFRCRIKPETFICGSFFYAFVEHYECKRNLSDAIHDLFEKDSKIRKIIEDFLQIFS